MTHSDTITRPACRFSGSETRDDIYTTVEQALSSNGLLAEQLSFTLRAETVQGPNGMRQLALEYVDIRPVLQ